MSATDRAAEAMEANIVRGAEGFTFCMEALRGNIVTGKMGYREGLTHRTTQESGGGQTRSQQAGGEGGVPT